MELVSAGLCERGLCRTVNQDRIGLFQRDGMGLFLVADGMGGHFRGERASECLRAGFEDWWETLPENPAFDTVLKQIPRILVACNRAILAQTPPRKLCGSTLTLLWLQSRKYILVNVGDSRCYQVFFSPWPRTGCVQLTNDDIVKIPEGAGGKLSRAVGVDGDCPYSLQTGLAAGRTLFALCSDGVYKYCPSDIWSRELSRGLRGLDLQTVAEHIAEHIQLNGAGDNYSLVFVRT